VFASVWASWTECAVGSPYELRRHAEQIAATRLWRDHGKRMEAHDLLAPVYGWFIEGFDTPVLQDAKALLDQLA